ncbi:GntR family transcriptional regulator [Streptomyces sp. BI20]|uniref:GntR family transcriptional regulator n=1 Tax=Streptomyces sp. BI20 TaxID=3403460 RepID=UPI003C73F2DE
MDTEGRRAVVGRVVVGREVAPEAVGAVLGLGEGVLALVRRRVFALEGKVVALAVSWLDAELVAGTAVERVDSGPGGIYARLGELGRGPVRFREEVRARMPSGAEGEALGLAVGTPVVLVCRTAYDAEGRVVEVNEMTLDASAYVLEYAFDA